MSLLSSLARSKMGRDLLQFAETNDLLPNWEDPNAKGITAWVYGGELGSQTDIGTWNDGEPNAEMHLILNSPKGKCLVNVNIILALATEFIRNQFEVATKATEQRHTAVQQHALINDQTVPLPVRCCALAAQEPHTQADYVVEQLSDPNIAPDWRATLLVMAEHLEFRSADQREKLQEALPRIIAESLENPNMLQEGIGSIELFSKVCRPTDENLLALLPLLEPKQYDSRFACLQAVKRFCRHAPNLSSNLDPLRNEIWRLLRQLPISHTMVLAIEALACLGDLRFNEFAQNLRSSHPSLYAELYNDFFEMLTNWPERSKQDNEQLQALRDVLSDTISKTAA